MIIIKQWLCDHSVFIEDIMRVSDHEVTAHCHKCGKELSAEYGLALKAKLDRKPKENHDRSR